MPWYEYRCTKCGQKAKRNRSLIYRDTPAIHNEAGGCGDGALKRSVALPGESEPIQLDPKRGKPRARPRRHAG